jgi:hypothetical protein
LVAGADLTLGCDFSVEHAFLWDKGQIIDLNRFVPPGSGIQLTEPSAISDRGEIATNGFLNGNLHAFVLVPCDEDHSDAEGCIDDTHCSVAVTQANSAADRTSSRPTPATRLASHFPEIKRAK